jgi:hypothetical protein
LVSAAAQEMPKKRRRKGKGFSLVKFIWTDVSINIVTHFQLYFIIWSILMGSETH